MVLGLFVALAAGTWTLVGPIFQFLQQLLPEGWCLEGDGGEMGWWLGSGLVTVTTVTYHHPKKSKGNNWTVEGIFMIDDGG